MHLYFARVENDEKVIEKFNELERPIRSGACYASIYVLYDGYGKEDTSNVYYGYFADPDIEKAIAKFNETFKNIKVVIVLKKMFPYCGETARINFRETPYSYYILRFEFIKSFTQAAKYQLSVILAQLFRGFDPEYSFLSAYKEHPDKQLHPLDKMLNVFTKTIAYGSWAGGRPFNFDVLLNLKNTRMMNVVAKSPDNVRYTMPYGSKFYDTLMKHLREKKD